MTQQFTASEVRNEASNHWRLSDGPQQTLAGKMLHAYADLLEAREKAVPMAYAEFADNGCVRVWSRGYEERLPGTRMVPLYTHSDPPDAERLAEALRAVLEAMYTAGGRDDDGGRPNSATEQIEHAERIALAALAAHSAQAQPPIASVPGELAEPSKGVLNYEQELSFAEGWNACRKAMLAAQENPSG